MTLVWTFAKTIGLLAVAILVSMRLTPHLFRVAAKFRTRGVLLAVGLSVVAVIVAVFYTWKDSARVEKVRGQWDIIAAATKEKVKVDDQIAAFSRGQSGCEGQLHPGEIICGDRIACVEILLPQVVDAISERFECRQFRQLVPRPTGDVD